MIFTVTTKQLTFNFSGPLSIFFVILTPRKGLSARAKRRDSPCPLLARGSYTPVSRRFTVIEARQSSNTSSSTWLRSDELSDRHLNGVMKPGTF